MLHEADHHTQGEYLERAQRTFFSSTHHSSCDEAQKSRKYLVFKAYTNRIQNPLSVYTNKIKEFPMEPSSEAKNPFPTTVSVETQTLDRITTALEKCNQLMERHLAAGELTVPARALYFILRDAGFGTIPTQTQEQKQTPKQQEVTSEIHYHHGMRR